MSRRVSPERLQAAVASVLADRTCCAGAALGLVRRGDVPVIQCSLCRQQVGAPVEPWRIGGQIRRLPPWSDAPASPPVMSSTSAPTPAAPAPPGDLFGIAALEPPSAPPAGLDLAALLPAAPPPRQPRQAGPKAEALVGAEQVTDPEHEAARTVLVALAAAARAQFHAYAQAARRDPADRLRAATAAAFAQVEQEAMVRLGRVLPPLRHSSPEDPL